MVGQNSLSKYCELTWAWDSVSACTGHGSSTQNGLPKVLFDKTHDILYISSLVF